LPIAYLLTALSIPAKRGDVGRTYSAINEIFQRIHRQFAGAQKTQYKLISKSTEECFMPIVLIFRVFQLFTMAAMGWMLISHLLSQRAALAQTAPFYQGKTIRIIVGFTAGGLYDQYARVLARHMPKYIPGTPNIIVQNMPGAGSLTATNYVYGVAKPDGLTLGMVASGIYLDQLLERKEAQFDMRKLNYIGSVDQRDLVLYMKADAPWKSVEDILNSSELPKCGATGTSDLTTIVLNILEETLGLKANNIKGYPGGVEIDLAMRRARFTVAAPVLRPTLPGSPILPGTKTLLIGTLFRPA